ncbi:MAG: hypothetical protein JNL25_15195 [Rhodospirillaceae bacterium]|nr:hypothetical protein [Rhodospirillaceae bacterium]
MTAILLAACAQKETADPSPEATAGRTSYQAVVEDLKGQLPDVATARCIGEMSFADGGLAVGRSSCGINFRALTATVMGDGLICVYSASPADEEIATLVATGYFACADERRGRVWFHSERGALHGTVRAESDAGEVIHFYYQEI